MKWSIDYFMGKRVYVSEDRKYHIMRRNSVNKYEGWDRENNKRLFSTLKQAKDFYQNTK